MTKEWTLNKSISIKAPVSKVWEALTNKELIKIYFFGTECTSDWKKGSPIYYRGVWDGNSYEDKGNILDIEPEKFILYNYWSSMSGTEDAPENYTEIRYELTADKNETTFTVIQGGFKTQEALEHLDKNWGFIMSGMKNLIES
ncbi:MAG TPA: SRPBCC family protein [Bacteroidia bacterium]|nr:SRPBCC family protein [Bacteroidia bacterium]